MCAVLVKHTTTDGKDRRMQISYRKNFPVIMPTGTNRQKNNRDFSHLFIKRDARDQVPELRHGHVTLKHLDIEIIYGEGLISNGCMMFEIR